MKTPTLEQLDIISVEFYGKLYSHLPDDGTEQDHVQHEFSRRQLHDLRLCVLELDAATGFNFAKVGKLTPQDYRDMAGIALAYGLPRLAESLRKGIN